MNTRRSTLLFLSTTLLLAGLLGCASSDPIVSNDPGAAGTDDGVPDDGVPDDGQEASSPALDPFRVLARTYAPCIPTLNHLWLVDDRWVVLVAETACADIGTTILLFDVVSQAELCRYWTDVAGGGVTCVPGGPSGLFETIRLNPSAPDLGLGPTHVVEPILF